MDKLQKFMSILVVCLMICFFLAVIGVTAIFESFWVRLIFVALLISAAIWAFTECRARIEMLESEHLFQQSKLERLEERVKELEALKENQ